MSRVSTFAGSSFSPERMLRSTTAPVSRFLNLVRVNAAPLPGFTNWNSTTVYGFPSISTLRPLRISDVSYMTRHVYLAHSGPVKPRIPRRSTAAAKVAPDACRAAHPCAISTAMDAAAHYRHLLGLEREEFLAAAAPAVFVHYRARAPGASHAGITTMTMTLDEPCESRGGGDPDGRAGGAGG